MHTVGPLYDGCHRNGPCHQLPWQGLSALPLSPSIQEAKLLSVSRHDSLSSSIPSWGFCPVCTSHPDIGSQRVGGIAQPPGHPLSLTVHLWVISSGGCYSD